MDLKDNYNIVEDCLAELLHRYDYKLAELTKDTIIYEMTPQRFFFSQRDGSQQ